MSEKINWQTVVASAAATAITAAAALATSTLGYLNKDRSLDIEMVRVSLSILSGENKDESLYGRKFALRALEKYSKVEIPTEDFDFWAAKGTIPELRFTSPYGYTEYTTIPKFTEPQILGDKQLIQPEAER